MCVIRVFMCVDVCEVCTCTGENFVSVCVCSVLACVDVCESIYARAEVIKDFVSVCVCFVC